MIIVAGANGFIGTALCRALVDQGQSLTAIVRDPVRAGSVLPKGTDLVAWDSPKLTQTVGEAEAVINLAGSSVVGKRWTPAYKQELRDSRLQATRQIVAAMRDSGGTGQTLINASAVGYYGDTGDQMVTEETPPGKDFLSDLCVAWEAEAREAEAAGVRVVLTRTGIVLGEGGALKQMLLPFKLGIGGPVGSGRQWMPWIHLDDVVGTVQWVIAQKDLRGPINVTTPNPVINREFTRTLGKVLHRPAVLPVPGFALRLMFGEFADALLTGQRLVPKALQASGYTWKYPLLERALQSILK
jgi:uncharacterized protein (TIGR01777 family)